MPLVIPQTQVTQIISSVVPAGLPAPKYAVIVGPRYAVRKYSAGGNNAGVALGAYDGSQLAVAWPSRGAGEVVDQAFTKVTFENALLQYFADEIGGGDAIAAVAGKLNQIASPSLIWATNTAGTRDASIPTDVLPGDAILIDDGVGHTLQTTVKSLVPSVVAAVFGSATAGTNAATQSQSATPTYTGSASTDLTIAAGSGYAGAAVGLISETYTVTVTTPGAPGVAVVSVVSASGTDDVAAVPITAYGAPIAIGTRGATLTWTHAGSDDFQAGDSWSLEVDEAYTAPTVARAGTYIGDQGTTYVVTVTRGGAVNGDLSTGALVVVTTLNGIDGRGPQAPTTATAFALGTLGGTFTVTGTKLVKGDTWTVTATPAGVGSIKTLELSNTLSAALLAASELQVTLYIEKTIDVPQDRVGHAPELNWDTSATEITLNTGIISTDARVAVGSVLTELPVVAGDAFVTYRALITTGASQIASVDPTLTTALATFGTIDADAVLPFAVQCALENSASVPVKYIPVASDDLAGYTAAFGSVANADIGYGFVVLSHDATIKALLRSVVNTRSGSASGKPAVGWQGGVLNAEKAQITVDEDGNVLTATIADDPDTSGTQYTILTDPVGGGKFLTNVRPGDTVRSLFTPDGFGNNSYQEFLVDAVLTDESLRLVTGPAAAVTLAGKYEIWRNLSLAEQAADYIAVNGIGDRRIRSVFPANPKRGGVAYPNYFLAASLAGLRSGVYANQPLSNIEVLGWDDMSEASSAFSAQLETLMNGGIWVVTQQAGGGLVYTLRQITTDVSDLRNAEDSIVATADHIVIALLLGTAGMTGKSNIFPEQLGRINVKLTTILNGLKDSVADDLGGYVTDYTQNALRRNAALPDHVYANYTVVVPTPFNNLDIDLEVTV